MFKDFIYKLIEDKIEMVIRARLVKQERQNAKYISNAHELFKHFTDKIIKLEQETRNLRDDESMNRNRITKLEKK